MKIPHTDISVPEPRPDVIDLVKRRKVARKPASSRLLHYESQGRTMSLVQILNDEFFHKIDSSCKSQIVGHCMGRRKES